MGRCFAVMMLLTLRTVGLAAAQGVPATAAGCYHLAWGDWEPRRSEGNEPYQTPPARITLLDSLGDAYFERGKRLVRPAIAAGHTPSAFWEPLGGDSIRVVWTSGFAGVVMRLEVTPAGLRGMAEAFTDVRVAGRAQPRAYVLGWRFECRTVENGRRRRMRGLSERRRSGGKADRFEPWKSRAGVTAPCAVRTAREQGEQKSCWRNSAM